MALTQVAGGMIASGQTITSPTLTSPTIDSAQVPTVSGTAPLYLCRAWVNFNGTGTVAIRASGNVTSITDGGTGDYTVNFTTAMPDANYAVERVASLAGYINAFAGNGFTQATTSCRIGYFYQNSGAGGAAWSNADPTEVSVSIFR